MLPDRPLNELFRTRSHAPVLRALYSVPPGIALSAREWSRRAGVAHTAGGRVLASLLDLGLVTAHRTPTATLYRLETRHAAHAALADLLAWERKLRQEVTDAIAEVARSISTIREATLFGSFTEPGAMHADSDIDIAIICAPGTEEETEDELRTKLDEVEARFGIRVEPLIRASDRRSRAPVWRSIETQGQRLIARSA